LGWPAVIVLVKPTLALFILSGMGRPKGLAIGLILFGILALPYGTMWLDWLTAIRNSDLDASYAVTQNALLVLPIIAWVSSSRSAGPSRAMLRRLRRPTLRLWQAIA
jgi:hypothetical protein